MAMTTTTTLTTAKRSRPFVLAFMALVLALTTPAIVVVATKLAAMSGLVASIAGPLIAFSILCAFAFHVRFALGALEAEKKGPSLLAWLAIFVGVSGFVGAMLVLMGIVG